MSIFNADLCFPELEIFETIWTVYFKKQNFLLLPITYYRKFILYTLHSLWLKWIIQIAFMHLLPFLRHSFCCDCKSKRASIGVKAFDLHVTDPGLFPTTIIFPLISPGTTPKHRLRSSPWVPLGLTQKYSPQMQNSKQKWIKIVFRSYRIKSSFSSVTTHELSFWIVFLLPLPL